MIPNVSHTLMTFERAAVLPGKTFAIDFDSKRAIGMIDEKEAVVQTIKLILSVERYKHTIYSWNYGVELESLFGEPVSYACPEIERRIKEALTQDDRILSVDAFSFDTRHKGKVHVTFTVKTIYGDIEKEEEVVV